ncbi:hypothetical protein GQX73_g4104 [Xylaria multiplex]|uniref:N-acetyltransferase domain-containing protein n=1 Tax=Xylaria multiplex TaxID=323545 RepID=A0A7C8IQ41_9PEZI|nr:hypothetical protein GQX73_g4104 [Xylaria multiplex]
MSTSKEVDVALLDDIDIPTCFKILSESFGHNAPFVNIYFPNHDTPSGQLQGSNRLTAWKHTSQNSVFLKAITPPDVNVTTTENIIGLAIWTHMKDIPPQQLEDAENVEEVWPDVNDRRFMAALWGDYVKPRTHAVRESRGKGAYVLELLAVHPDYQRLGAGAKLVSWGTKAADEAQIKAVVEGTPVAKRLYEKCGFRAEIERMRFDAAEEFAERTKPQLIFLTREPLA